MSFSRWEKAHPRGYGRINQYPNPSPSNNIFPYSLEDVPHAAPQLLLFLLSLGIFFL